MQHISVYFVRNKQDVSSPSESSCYSTNNKKVQKKNKTSKRDGQACNVIYMLHVYVFDSQLFFELSKITNIFIIIFL